MNNLKQEIINARNERETGDPNKALEMFLQIDKQRLDSNQLFDYLGELGLTYWHLKRFDEAKSTFEKIRLDAEKDNNDSHLAVALRHLSRPEFNEDNPSTAVEYAKKARQLAKESNRKDIAWFDHGVVSALIFNESPQDEILEWYETESKDIYEVSRNVDDEIAKWVWVTGLLIDRSKTFNTIGDLYVALMIADQFNLARRMEQIEKLVEEFKK